MYQLIQLFFDIARLSKGPQDVPASSWLLSLVIPVYGVVNVSILLLSDDWSVALLQIVVDFLMLVAFSWPLLYFSGKPSRFPQTLGALLGVDCIISFFALPVVAALNSQANEFAVLAMLFLMAWHWVVSGHIFRHALDKPLFFGLGLSLLYILISSQVMALLFPIATTTS